MERLVKEITRVVSIDDIVLHCIDSEGNNQKIKIKLRIPDWLASEVVVSAEQHYENILIPFSKCDTIRRPTYVDFKMSATCGCVEADIEQ